MFKGYAAGIYLLETVLGVFTLGFFNVLSAIRFREKMIRKGHLLRNRTETRQKEVMYTKMVLILSTVCFVTRLLDAVTRVLARLFILKIYEFSVEAESRILQYHDISWMLLLAAHAFDNWIYLLMDPNLRRCTRELFCRPTTQTTLLVPLVPLILKKKIKKEKQVPEKLVHSSSSFMVVQNEMLLSEMNDRINEMVIYEEPTDPDNSIDLYENRCPTPPLVETEDFDTIVSWDTASTRKPKHTFEIKISKKEDVLIRTVSLITRFDIHSVHWSKFFSLVKTGHWSNDPSDESKTGH